MKGLIPFYCLMSPENASFNVLKTKTPSKAIKWPKKKMDLRTTIICIVFYKLGLTGNFQFFSTKA